MAVRALVAVDREGWERLWRGYLSFYRAPLDPDVASATFERLIEETGPMTGLVMEAEGELVGLAHLVFHPSTWSSHVSCYLEDLFVAPSARGTGASRSLLRAVFAEADRRGADRTYWVTQEYNGAARSLYDVVGRRTSFVVYER